MLLAGMFRGGLPCGRVILRNPAGVDDVNLSGTLQPVQMITDGAAGCLHCGENLFLGTAGMVVDVGKNFFPVG